MARNPHETRERLIESAQTLFAREGIYQVPLKRIVEHAGQRNASALHYHYGNRDGLLHEIIIRHDDPIQAERHLMLAAMEQQGSGHDLRRLIEALVLPFSRELETASGREYLQIVSQLSMLFDLWDIDLPQGPTETQRMFHAMSECMAGIPPEIRHARITTLLGLVAEALAARARMLDAPSAALPLSHEAFATNLVDMGLGALLAESTVSIPTAAG